MIGVGNQNILLDGISDAEFVNGGTEVIEDGLAAIEVAVTFGRSGEAEAQIDRLWEKLFEFGRAEIVDFVRDQKMDGDAGFEGGLKGHQ